MIEALQDWESGRIQWIHIGDGPLLNEIIQLAKEKLSNNKLVSYSFLGHLDNKEVHEVMKNESIDVFVNMSQSEGVPISIMEAMSVGIPIIAPSIFGIPELVDENCGILFESTKGVSGLRNSIELFDKLSSEQRCAMGKAAYNTWKDRFCLEDNLSLLLQV